MPGPMDQMAGMGGGMPPGMGGGMGPGMDPSQMGGGFPPQAGPTDPAAAMSLDAMGGLLPKSSNPTQALAQADKGLMYAHQIVMTLLPQVSQWNGKMAKDLHTIGRQLQQARMDLQKEADDMAPPPLLGGMDGGAGATGLPSSGPQPGSMA